MGKEKLVVNIQKMNSRPLQKESPIPDFKTKLAGVGEGLLTIVEQVSSPNFLSKEKLTPQKPKQTNQTHIIQQSNFQNIA